MGRRLEYEVKTSVRLNMSNPQHVKINDVIQNLDPKIFKSKNQFIIDAIQFYIDNYGKETFVIKKKEKERAEYIRSEDIDDIKEEVIEAATNEARKEVIKLLGGVISGMNVGQPVIMQAANSEAQEPTWTSDAKEAHVIKKLVVGETYTLREEFAPYGYLKATFEVKETAEIQKVSMKDEQAVGKIVIEKTDKVTGKPIEGVVFEVRDKDGKVLDTLTTDKNGHAESKELPICTYNEDGSFKEDIHYTVVETKAADGYILDETAHDVTLRYDDNAPEVVVTTLKLVNVPTEPKLPQTGDNANPLLYLGIGALALITGVGVGLRGRKKKNKQ